MKLPNPFQFAYNAIVDKGFRKPAISAKKDESVTLDKKKWEKLGATVYDLIQNSPEAGWAYGKFLDYTTSFVFQARTVDRDFNKAAEKAVANWGMKHNCDVSRRHDLAEMIRLYGAGMCLDGHAAILKIKGLKLQGVEGDRIAKPDAGKIPQAVKDYCNEWGMILDPQGAVDQYVICNRAASGSGKEFAQLVSWQDIIWDGFFYRFDQVQGVTPFASAVTKFKDVCETDELQQIKSKKHACFGVLLKSSGKGGTGFGERNGTEGSATPSTSEDGLSKYMHNMGAGIKIEGDQQDGVEMFESKNPSTEYQQFSESQIRKALAIFKIPYSFFDSKTSSYSAQKQDRAEFTNGVKPFRGKILNALYEITDWALPGILASAGLTPPKPTGIVLKNDTAIIDYEWQSLGEPWLDENNETQAAEKRIAMGISSRQLECKRRNLDFSTLPTI